MDIEKIINIMPKAGVSKETLEVSKMTNQTVNSLKEKLESLISRPIDSESTVASLLQEQKQVYSKLLEVLSDIDLSKPTREQIETLSEQAKEEERITKVINRVVDSKPTHDIAQLRENGHLNAQLKNYITPLVGILNKSVDITKPVVNAGLGVAGEVVKPLANYGADNIAAMAGPLGVLTKDLLESGGFRTVAKKAKELLNSIGKRSERREEKTSQRVEVDIEEEVANIEKDTQNLQAANDKVTKEKLDSIQNSVNSVLESLNSTVSAVNESSEGNLDKTVMSTDVNQLDELARAKMVVAQAREEARAKGMASVMRPDEIMTPHKEKKPSRDEGLKNSTEEILDRINDNILRIIAKLDKPKKEEDSKSSGSLDSGSVISDTKKGVVSGVTSGAISGASMLLPKAMKWLGKIPKAGKVGLLVAAGSAAVYGLSKLYDSYASQEEKEEFNNLSDEEKEQLAQQLHSYVRSDNSESSNKDSSKSVDKTNAIVPQYFSKQIKSLEESGVKVHYDEKGAPYTVEKDLFGNETKQYLGMQTGAVPFVGKGLGLIKTIMKWGAITAGADWVMDKYQQFSDKSDVVQDQLQVKPSVESDIDLGNLDSLKPPTEFADNLVDKDTIVDYSKLAAVIAKGESGGNYAIENTLGFLGKHQHGWASLAESGYIDLNKAKELSAKGYTNKEIINSDVWTGKGGIYSKEDFLGVNDPEFDKKHPERYKGLKSQIAQEDASRQFYQRNLQTFNRLNVEVAGKSIPLREAAEMAGFDATMFLGLSSFGAGNASNYIKYQANIAAGYNVEENKRLLASMKDAYGTDMGKYAKLLGNRISDDYYRSEYQKIQDEVLSQQAISDVDLSGIGSYQGSTWVPKKEADYSSIVENGRLNANNPELYKALGIDQNDSRAWPKALKALSEGAIRVPKGQDDKGAAVIAAYTQYLMSGGDFIGKPKPMEQGEIYMPTSEMTERVSGNQPTFNMLADLDKGVTEEEKSLDDFKSTMKASVEENESIMDAYSEAANKLSEERGERLKGEGGGGKPLFEFVDDLRGTEYQKNVEKDGIIHVSPKLKNWIKGLNRKMASAKKEKTSEEIAREGIVIDGYDFPVVEEEEVESVTDLNIKPYKSQKVGESTVQHYKMEEGTPEPVSIGKIDEPKKKEEPKQAIVFDNGQKDTKESSNFVNNTVIQNYLGPNVKEVILGR